MLASSRYQLTQEYHLIPYFLDRYVIVLDPLKGTLHLVQLVVMGSEQRLRLRIRVLMNIFHDRPSDRYAIVGTGTPP